MTDPRADHLRASPSQRLYGRISVPGDKSISHRALILGALAEGETGIEGLLESADILHTARALQTLGADVGRAVDGSWLVRGTCWHSPGQPVDCGNSGTGARLLMGAAAGFPIEATFTGDASLLRRPMRRVIDPLSAMGASIAGRDTLPVTVRGGRLKGISLRNVPASAQVKSAVLLAGLKASGPVEIIEPAPTRDHTEQLLRQFGCDIDVTDGHQGRTVQLGAKRELQASHVVVPGDPSSAAFPLVATLISPGSEVTALDVLDSPLRSGLFETLVEMGATLKMANRRSIDGMAVMDLTAKASALIGIEVPAARVPALIDEYPILAVAAAFARGRTVMHGLAELRVKESDRLAAVIDGLCACGVRAWAEDDSLVVEGTGEAPQGGVVIKAHYDHRIAMSFLILGLGAHEPVTVDSAAMIATSFPGFAELMASIGADIDSASLPQRAATNSSLTHGRCGAEL